MIKIGILGFNGRMGQAIAAEIAATDGCVLAAGADRAVKPEYKKDGLLLTTKVDEAVAASDVVIDFTLADAMPEHAKIAAAHKKPFMSGVTGVDPAGLEILKQTSAKIPLLYSANTSVSLAVMKEIVTLASKLLAGHDYDIAIHDEHHRMKKDAPSGTAKALGDAVARGNGGRKAPQYSAVRAGAIVGEHEVAFVGQGEIIRLHHTVTDRAIFARGAVKAAMWLYGKQPGFYGMDDVLGIGH